MVTKLNRAIKIGVVLAMALSKHALKLEVLLSLLVSPF